MPGLSDISAAIEKKFSRTNKEIVFDAKRVIEWLPTGIPVFDLVTGGGFPRGRISEVFGMEHSCKTNFTLAAIAQTMKDDPKAVSIFMDHETSWAPSYAKEVFGLEKNGDTFEVYQPDNLEEGDMILDALFAIDRLDLIVFDSVDAMRPKAQIEHTQADGVSKVGAHAMGMGRLIQKVKLLAKKKNCAVVFINQMRTAINTSKYEQSTGTAAGYNVMESYATQGGHALRFYASLRIKAEFGGQITDEAGGNVVMGDVAEKLRIGNMIKVINVKNKVSTPFLKGLTSFYFYMPHREQVGGFSPGHDLLEMLKKRGRIRQQSTRFIYNGLNIPEWTNIGSKAASETAFVNNQTLLDDARALLRSLTETDKGKAEVLEIATLGEDFTDDETSENSAAIELAAEGIAILDVEAEMAEDDAEPLETVSV